MNTANHISGPGRPREFDTDVALQAAIRQFSANGYHGTSITDLNKALGLTTGSIYKAWGDKRGLLMASLERYLELRNEAVATALAAAPNGLARIKALLLFYAETSSGETGRIGCLVIELAVELAAQDILLADRLALQQATLRNRFETLLSEAVADSSLRRQVDIKEAADILLVITQGMRLLGKTGTSPERAQAIAQTALDWLNGSPSA